MAFRPESPSAEFMPVAAYLSLKRQKALIHYSLTLLLLLCPFIAQAKINVVATLPDLGSLAREIGKDKVNVVVLGKPNDNPHFVEPRSEFVASLHNADVLIDVGAGLEMSWLPPVLQKAHNPKVDVGKPGRVQASQGIRLMRAKTRSFTTRLGSNLRRRSRTASCTPAAATRICMRSMRQPAKKNGDSLMT